MVAHCLVSAHLFCDILVRHSKALRTSWPYLLGIRDISRSLFRREPSLLHVDDRCHNFASMEKLMVTGKTLQRKAACGCSLARVVGPRKTCDPHYLYSKLYHLSV
jgi:hypothetical protein